ncbi:hypothetical protein [Arcanobacterium phocae]|uniref:hypothetical protein n=1 Tax=Arcanobacterium phocae TaxID=131112 RepID=UPI001C0EED9E|nr:hypothetical protein [Arcanobacterium phocae]
MKRSISTGLATIVMVMGAALTASALSYTGSRYGQYTNTSGSFISIKDNAGEGKFPAVNYKYDGGTNQDGLANKSGYGTTVTKYAPSKITAIQPCLSRSAPFPMGCGDWIY